ncbi:hypothetical protein AVEN_255384-1 [Araneus ventricosus]|uniref:Uncharacterized protein n=1 Tax=Araneus ventricosus TaxID=182803 RepID=A0A4Y2SE75_ARAVE|nr:hypothetical protein AVEN_255384-1 [Araneus ventricosus]
MPTQPHGPTPPSRYTAITGGGTAAPHLCDPGGEFLHMKPEQLIISCPTSILEIKRVIGKDMAEEALGFFREYKKDLGKLYDNVVDKIGKILKS